MDISDFYSFRSKLLSTTFQAKPAEEILCDSSDGLDKSLLLLLGKFKEIKFPLQFGHTQGNKLVDMLDTGLPGVFLISQKMKNILEINKLNGWISYPVILSNKKSEIIPAYYGFSVLGRCGRKDFSKSTIIEKQLVPGGPITKYYKGLHIGLDEWDGSDFFVAKGSFGIYTSKRAMEVIKTNKLSNIRFENLMDQETHPYTVEVHYNNVEKNLEYFA